MTHKSKERSIKNQSVIFNLTNHTSNISSLGLLAGKSGWMFVSCLTIHAYDNEQYLVYARIDEDGNIIDEEVASKMFRILGDVQGEVEPTSVIKVYWNHKRKKYDNGSKNNPSYKMKDILTQRWINLIIGLKILKEV